MDNLKQRFSGRRRAAHTTARGLGWFSIGLGLLELVAPHALARAVGMPRSAAMVRACGVREIATGIALLAAKDPRPWVWARVAGDAIDVAGLGRATASGERKPVAALALGAVAGVTAADLATGAVLNELERKRRTPWPDYSDRSGWPDKAVSARARAVPAAADRV